MSLLTFKRGRVIDALRAHVPGVWCYDMRADRWVHESGLTISRRAMFAPRFDGDDDSFATVYIREDNGGRVNPWLGTGLT